MKNKLFFTVLFFALFCSKTQAQYGVQLSLMQPTGGLEYILKPALCIDLGLRLGKIDQRYRFGASLGYCNFKTTLKTFPTWGYTAGGGQNTKVFEGTHKITHYDIVPITLTNEFKIIKRSFSPFLGMDFFFNLITISQDKNIPGVLSYSEMNTYYYNVGVTPKVGVVYEINEKLLLQSGVGYKRALGGLVPGQGFWQTYISINFYKQ